MILGWRRCITMPEAPTELRNPEVRHEGSDVSLRGIIITAAAMIIAAVVIHFVVALVFDILTKRKPARTPAISPAPGLTIDERIKKLQQAGQPPLEEFERHEGIETPTGSMTDTRLEQYRPTDEAGYARIPIERAMELLAQQEKEKRARRGDLDRPTPSNAGRGPAAERSRE